MQNLDDIISLAMRGADEARRITLGHFRSPLAVEDKPDESPVTLADRESEIHLRKLIMQHFPEHGIFGEEFENTRLDADTVWIIDPIDGTGSFVFGMPLYGTLISVLHQKQPLLGIIDMPALDERWVGVKGNDCKLNGQVCHTSDCSSLAQARMLATTPAMFNTEELARHQQLSQQVKLSRFGGDCYCYGLLASGHVDLVVESDLKPYDYMAHINVIEAAGGVISDWQGNPLSLDSAGQVVAAASPSLHEQALAQLNT